MNGIIISGFAGVGKTSLATKYPKTIIDLESSKYKWIYNKKKIKKEHITGKEELKGFEDRMINPDWPQNYIKDIIENINKFDIILVSQGKEVRKILDAEKIEYIIVYPSIDCKEEYINRYIQRGNRKDFIDSISMNFEKWIKNLDQLKKNKIILYQNETLEEKLQEYKYI